jgi:hypothetical protein
MTSSIGHVGSFSERQPFIAWRTAAPPESYESEGRPGEPPLSGDAGRLSRYRVGLDALVINQ